MPSDLDILPGVNAIITALNGQPSNLDLRPAVNTILDLVVSGAVGGSGTAWGSITGDLTAQADLQTVLNTKANTSSLATVATTGSYNDLANKPTIPTLTSQLTNDSSYITAAQAPVQSVNGLTGVVSLTTTNITEGTNQYFTTTRVLATTLTGLSTATNSAVTSSDTVLTAPGKLQAQITALPSATQTLTNKTISGASNTITNISLTTAVTGVLPIANGGTGSATQNFVDLATDQTAAGRKTFSGGLTVVGNTSAAVNNDFYIERAGNAMMVINNTGGRCVGFAAGGGNVVFDYDSAGGYLG